MRIRDNGQTADIITRFDYKPYGEKMPVTSQLPGAPEPKPQRLGFISKEQDRESRLADHGVRKYDYDLGRFTSTDALFEKYQGWSPYQYSLNNPINLLDWNGKDAVAEVDGCDITIHAVYLVNTEMYTPKDINLMNETISSELNKNENVVTEGPYSGYNVQFSLVFVPTMTETGEMLNPSDFKCENISIGNEFSKNSPENDDRFAKRFEKIDGKIEVAQDGGYTDKNKYILMNSEQDNLRNRIHEIFHTLFFNNDRSTSGIGSYQKKDMPNKVDINNLINNPELQKVTK